MGALDESDFLSGMTICDAVVFPYLEVGQSSSGPISQALELGCRIIASRTHAFLEFAEYHKDAVEFFDIGNHLELAERLSARRQFRARGGLPEFNLETNKATYLLANSRRARVRGRAVEVQTSLIFSHQLGSKPHQLRLSHRGMNSTRPNISGSTTSPSLTRSGWTAPPARRATAGPSAWPLRLRVPLGLLPAQPKQDSHDPSTYGRITTGELPDVGGSCRGNHG
jgi:hypothetical protein